MTPAAKSNFEFSILNYEFWRFLSRISLKGLMICGTIPISLIRLLKIGMNQRLKNNMSLKLILTAVFLVVVPPVFAQAPNPPPNPVYWGSLDVGVQGVGWQASSALPDNGTEFLTPLTLSAIPWKGGKIFAQTEYAVGSYTDSQAGTETLSLQHLSDTVLGLETDFKSFNLPSLLSLGINIPTGDPAWETEETYSIVPTEFIDSDYKGRGFGTSLLYGLSLQAGGEQYGIAAGYMYTGAFNPYYGQVGTPAEQLKLGDSTFLSLNRVADHGGGQSDVLRFSAFYFLPTTVNGSSLLTMGPNLNASYGWTNPKALSFDAGVQYFLPTQMTGSANASLGTRFYLTPSYAFGDFAVAGRVKYILANDYPTSSYFYDGGGFLLGIEPSYRLKLDASSQLRFFAGFDYVVWQNADIDQQLGRVAVDYAHWTFGTHYEVSL